MQWYSKFKGGAKKALKEETILDPTESEWGFFAIFDYQYRPLKPPWKHHLMAKMNVLCLSLICSFSLWRPGWSKIRSHHEPGSLLHPNLRNWDQNQKVTHIRSGDVYESLVILSSHRQLCRWPCHWLTYWHIMLKVTSTEQSWRPMTRDICDQSINLNWTLRQCS